MKKINRILNLLINYTESPDKITFLMKMNMKAYVIFLLNMLMNQIMILFLCISI